jgi:hypothetical protein
VGRHCLSVDRGQDQTRCNAPFGADGPKKIGPLIAGIAGRTGPGATSGPKPGEDSLLADPCFILKPDFQRFALRRLGNRRLYRRAEVFLNVSCASGSDFGCCGRTESLRYPNAAR